MKTFLYLLVILMGIFSCDSVENPDNDDNYYNLDIGIEMTLVNEQGLDLLRPTNSNAFLEESIKIYYLINGKMEEVYNPDMDLPRNFSINAPENGDSNKYWMRLTLNISDTSDVYPITFIKWNDTDTDTLKCAFKSGKGYTICTKVFFNDELVWEGDGSLGRYFEIIK